MASPAKKLRAREGNEVSRARLQRKGRQDDAPAGKHHAAVPCAGLERAAENEDERADKDGLLAAERVGDVGAGHAADERAEQQRRRDEAHVVLVELMVAHEAQEVGRGQDTGDDTCEGRFGQGERVRGQRRALPQLFRRRSDDNGTENERT